MYTASQINACLLAYKCITAREKIKINRYYYLYNLQVITYFTEISMNRGIRLLISDKV